MATDRAFDMVTATAAWTSDRRISGIRRFAIGSALEIGELVNVALWGLWCWTYTLPFVCPYSPRIYFGELDCRVVEKLLEVHAEAVGIERSSGALGSASCTDG